MQSIYYVLSYVSKHTDLPGMQRFCQWQKIYGPALLAPVDRTGQVKFPVRMKSLFPMPAMRNFTKQYEEICDERAQQLLHQAEKLDTQIYAFWSGGIDSTCVLVSLIKNATASQKERLVVLMSEESIREYPLFYYKYVRGQLRCESATTFPYLLGTKKLMVTGELNDQLMGSDVIMTVMKYFGFDVVKQPYDREFFTSFFQECFGGNRDDALWYSNFFERFKERSPVPLKTNYDVFWWINFAVKWQSCYARMLSFVAKRNIDGLTKDYVENYYAPFFNTKDFQLWSMNNTDKRIKDAWCSYKWPSKDVIYNLTHDTEYRNNKTKRGSLCLLVGAQVPYHFIDRSYSFHLNVPPKDFYDEGNSFISS